MSKITVKDSITGTPEEIELTYPIFRFESTPDYEIFTCRTSDTHMVGLKFSTGFTECHVTTNVPVQCDVPYGKDYVLGLNDFACPEAVFMRAANLFLERFKNDLT